MKTRRILNLVLSGLLLVGAVALAGFARFEREGRRFAALDVAVQEVDGMYLVDEVSVRNAILAHDSIRGSFYGDVALNQVARWVKEALPAVGTVRVYPGLNDHLQVAVTQRRPLARWHRGGEGDCYLDEEGLSMPLSPVFTARVPVIFADTEAEALRAFGYLEVLEESPVWKAFTDGIVVEGEDVELIPRLGGARIALGDLAQIHSQLDHLNAFYREQIARGNLNDYKRISLKYEGQIVAQRHY